MKLHYFEYNIFSYLLATNTLSHDRAVEWAYCQYGNDGVEPFIEKIALTIDSAEIRELISNTFQVYGTPDKEFLSGEVVEKFFTNQLSLYEAIAQILFDIQPEMAKEDEQKMYIAEDYFGWHKNTEEEALKVVQDIFKKYHTTYKNAVSTFGI
ncbi:hypothetical protein [Glaciecola sp. KUL10]|uniref:hypothetical protein n=1 Tax=Glaciecola sp. (strain KUL10) TaxID=2161813 RepID=UPI000D782DF6|nr:hypothetical protein [Glaciecola sp. KUL10]GBL06340.1 hypothetical protein KUL10_36850 [Glaciecola sp. KUL10]